MELGTEKSATQKLESGKLVLERQNKELKAKLAELETAARTKTKVGKYYYHRHRSVFVYRWTGYSLSNDIQTKEQSNLLLNTSLVD